MQTRTTRRRGRLAKLLAPTIVSVGLLAACGTSVDSADAVSGAAFPELSADTVNGPQLDFGSLEGQDTVLWFWAPW